MSLNILLRVQDLSSFTLNVYTDYVAYYNNLMNLFITVSVTGEGSLMVYSTILTKQSFKTLSLQKHDLTSFEFEVSKFWSTSKAFSRYLSAWLCSFNTVLVSILLIIFGMIIDMFSTSPIRLSIIDISSWGSIGTRLCWSLKSTKNESIASNIRSLFSS